MDPQTSCIADNYKDITELRPKYWTNPDEHNDCCTEATYFICCLPMIIPLWISCCIAVTGKKIKTNLGKHMNCKKEISNKSTTNVQPK